MKFEIGDIVKSKLTKVVVLVTGENKTLLDSFKGFVVEKGKSAYNVFYYSKYWNINHFKKTNCKIKLIKK